MTINERVSELKGIVSQYDTESFAGFFAHFIRHRPDGRMDIELNKFESKWKDFFYLIALNLSAVVKGNEPFEFSPKVIGLLADKLNKIKECYRVNKPSDYTLESVIHEMAFRNHFDNAVLSYVEQDLERIRTTFLPFEDRIIESIWI